MIKIVQGVVRGKTIALQEDSGFAEGQAVELTIRTVAQPADQKRGEGFLRTEGALADDPHWDAIMAEIHQERKNDTRKELPE